MTNLIGDKFWSEQEYFDEVVLQISTDDLV